MSQGINYLHSHSGIERERKFPKHIVLVDERFKDEFNDCPDKITPYKVNGKTYYKVPILLFIAKGGVFKNLNS